MRRRSGPRQLSFPAPRTWGGRRAGAGRKPNGERAGHPHARRPDHHTRHPVHLTMRAVSGLSSFRAPHVFPAVRLTEVTRLESELRDLGFEI